MERTGWERALQREAVALVTRGIMALWLVTAMITGGCIPVYTTPPQTVSSHARLLAELPFPATSPLFWSPRGDTLVLSAGDVLHGGISQVYAIGVATAAIHVVVDGSEHLVSRVTSWASDDRHFLFVAESPTHSREQGLWKVDVSRTESTAFLVEGNGAAWSPKSKALAVYRTSPERDRVTIDLYDFETREEKRIFAEPAFSLEDLRWSPDGTRLAFVLTPTQAVPGGDVTILNVADGTIIPLTTDGQALGLSWSPDGDMIAYSRWQAGASKLPAEVHISKVDGGCDTRAPGTTGIHNPAWSPDGKWLAYSDGPRIYLYDLAAAFGQDFLNGGLKCP